MGFFPFFIDLEQKEGLIAGGGATALRKVQKLLPYGPRLTVAAPVLRRELEELPGLTLLRQPFSPQLLEGKYFAVAATGDPALNRQISQLCRHRGILVNAVDDREACTFLFPALVKRGELSVGISTGGASPSAAIWLKEQTAALLPQSMEEILSYLERQRDPVRALFPQQAQRGRALKALFLACMDRQRPLDGAETRALLAQCRKEADQ